MKARKIYESLEDYGFDENEIAKFISSKYGDVITLELEFEKNDIDDCTDYLFANLDKSIEWHAKPNDIEEFDLGRTQWLTFTIKGKTKNIIEALINWWYVEKKDVYDFIKNHIIV